MELLIKKNKYSRTINFKKKQNFNISYLLSKIFLDKNILMKKL